MAVIATTTIWYATFFFSLNPFININSTLNPKMRTISDRLSLEHDASDRKYMKYFYL